MTRTSLSALVLLALGGCATPGPRPGLKDLLDRAAERNLYDGLRAYEEGQDPAAERSLRHSLSHALSSPRDRATAHKLLAFIQCTSNRPAECEAEFRAARLADPGFALNRAESGHPQWGPVYRKVMP